MHAISRDTHPIPLSRGDGEALDLGVGFKGAGYATREEVRLAALEGARRDRLRRIGEALERYGKLLGYCVTCQASDAMPKAV